MGLAPHGDDGLPAPWDDTDGGNCLSGRNRTLQQRWVDTSPPRERDAWSCCIATLVGPRLDR